MTAALEPVTKPKKKRKYLGNKAKFLGRGYVGTEIDPEWVQRGIERVERYPLLSDRDAERLDRWQVSGGKLPEAA